MVQLAQSDIASSLPDLLDGINRQSVVILENGTPRAAVVSMERYNELVKLDLAEMQAISREMSARVAEHARELGITHEQLVERLLADDEPL